VRSYANVGEAFAALAKLGPSAGKPLAVYVQDHDSGLKLFASDAWYVRGAHGNVTAFLQKAGADAYAQHVSGSVVDYAAAVKTTASSQAVAAR
jgi:NitT/TauT family transport system substrate-binding protein